MSLGMTDCVVFLGSERRIVNFLRNLFTFASEVHCLRVPPVMPSRHPTPAPTHTRKGDDRSPFFDVKTVLKMKKTEFVRFIVEHRGSSKELRKIVKIVKHSKKACTSKQATAYDKMSDAQLAAALYTAVHRTSYWTTSNTIAVVLSLCGYITSFEIATGQRLTRRVRARSAERSPEFKLFIFLLAVIYSYGQSNFALRGRQRARESQTRKHRALKDFVTKHLRAARKPGTKEVYAGLSPLHEAVRKAYGVLARALRSFKKRTNGKVKEKKRVEAIVHNDDTMKRGRRHSAILVGVLVVVLIISAAGIRNVDDDSGNDSDRTGAGAGQGQSRGSDRGSDSDSDSDSNSDSDSDSNSDSDSKVWL